MGVRSAAVGALVGGTIGVVGGAFLLPVRVLSNLTIYVFSIS